MSEVGLNWSELYDLRELLTKLEDVFTVERDSVSLRISGHIVVLDSNGSEAGVIRDVGTNEWHFFGNLEE